MRVLILAGAGALALTMPITIGIVIVLAIVVVSYQQTIRAYPNGGGSYIVASENLGRRAGLTAAGALLTDYVLTVAVSVAAGVAALTSIFPELFECGSGSASGLSGCWPSAIFGASGRALPVRGADLCLSRRDLRPHRFWTLQVVTGTMPTTMRRCLAAPPRQGRRLDCCCCFARSPQAPSR